MFKILTFTRSVQFWKCYIFVKYQFYHRIPLFLPSFCPQWWLKTLKNEKLEKIENFNDSFLSTCFCSCISLTNLSDALLWVITWLWLIFEVNVKNISLAKADGQTCGFFCTRKFIFLKWAHLHYKWFQHFSFFVNKQENLMIKRW